MTDHQIDTINFITHGHSALVQIRLNSKEVITLTMNEYESWLDGDPVEVEYDDYYNVIPIYEDREYSDDEYIAYEVAFIKKEELK